MVLLALSALLIIGVHKASLFELPAANVAEDLDDVGDVEAQLQTVHECPESSSLVFRWLDPKVERLSADTMALTVGLNLTKEIPFTPSFVADIFVESQPGDDVNQRSPVVSFSWPNICGDLKSESNDAVKAFKNSIEGGLDCPIKPGQYVIKQYVMSIADVKPFLRDGKMIFTVKQMLDGKPICCNVVEFLVSWG